MGDDKWKVTVTLRMIPGNIYDEIIERIDQSIKEYITTTEWGIGEEEEEEK